MFLLNLGSHSWGLPALISSGSIRSCPLGYAMGRPAPEIPQDQRDRIKVFIVSPDQVNVALERLGGSWVQSGAAFSPPAATRLTWGEGAGNENWYQLVAYARQ